MNLIAGGAAHGLSDLAIALLGAVVGGVLTIAGDAGIGAVQDWRRFRGLREGLLAEAKVLLHEAQLREAAVETGIAFRSPLPSLAWEAVVREGVLGRFSADEGRAARDLYAKTSEANYLARQGGLLFAAAQLADPGPAEGLTQEARRLSTAPYSAVVTSAREILSMTGELS